MNYLPGFGNGGWSLPGFSSFPNIEHKNKITSLESEVTDLKDLVNQHRDTVNSKFVSNFKIRLIGY